jgi:hypothetical protein
MRSDIIQRVLSVIHATTSDRRRSKELEEETGIPDRNWKQVWNGKQRPTAHMIEALCRRWPQYAFWLATGITDERNGHTAPRGAWTCSQDTSTKESEEAASNYFGMKMYYQDIMYGPSGAASSNYVLKKLPTEAEIEAAGVIMKSKNPKLQGLLDDLFGKDVQVWGKKYSDLDDAIAQLAFERRLEWFSARYPGINKGSSDVHTQLEKADSERLAIREKDTADEAERHAQFLKSMSKSGAGEENEAQET